MSHAHTVIAAMICALALPLLPGLPAAAAPPTESWLLDVSTVDGDDSNVVAGAGAIRLAGGTADGASVRAPVRHGMLTTAARNLARPANRIAVELGAAQPAGSEVLVDVRGRRPDGMWEEWTRATGAPALFAAPIREVQARITLLAAPGGAGPEIRSVRLTADTAATGRVESVNNRPPLSFQVFATREGLVGGTTANGHVIVEHDHFVALPSRRGLSRRGAGDYSVQLCASNGRCAWAPVWDVGPWNTTDDYWNPTPPRERWGELPHGKPQSQAAFHDGHNGGHDQFGRVVRNPAGIDLADGTFRDGLGLTTNAWVTVTYLWTGGGAFGTIQTPGPVLNVRAAPNTDAPPVGLAAKLATVRIECERRGQLVNGTQGSSDLWLRIGPAHYVARAYVTGAPPVPACG